MASNEPRVIAALVTSSSAAATASDAEFVPSPAAALTAATPDLALGVVFLLTWVAPHASWPDLPGRLMLVMVLEFIIIHSSAFIGMLMFGPAPRRTRAMGVAGLGAFYTLFVGAFCLSFHNVWPLVSFWALMVNRLLSVLVGQAPGGAEKLFIRKGWAASSIFYLGFTALTLLAPVPRLGLTPEVVSHLRVPGSGLWIDQPWRLMAFGFLYFTAVGISELFGHRWISAKNIPTR